MRIRTGILLLLTGLLFSGCNLTEDDADLPYFVDTWRLEMALADDTAVTPLLMARYDAILFTFFEEDERFTLLADVSDSGDDLITEGAFEVDSDERAFDLASDALGSSIDFTYEIVDHDRLVLITDDDNDRLEAFFGIDFGETDELTLVLTRADDL